MGVTPHPCHSSTQNVGEPGITGYFAWECAAGIRRNMHRAVAGIPQGLTLTTKPQLGLAMLDRALAAGVPFAWLTGDSVYGTDHRIRRRLEARQRGYVLTVTSGQRLGFVAVKDWLAKVPPPGWQRLSAGEGAQGLRLYDWAYLPYRGATPGWRIGLLIRRSTAKPDDVTYYLTSAPDDTMLAQLVRVAGTRWTSESCFEAAKGEVGLDEYDVRSWGGWHRHITLAMLAHAYLGVLRKTALGGTRRARPRQRAAAADRARGATPALASRLRTRPQPRCRPALVQLAQAPSAAGTAMMPLAQKDQVA
jgi:SRSO17 transposase